MIPFNRPSEHRSALARPRPGSGSIGAGTWRWGSSRQTKGAASDPAVAAIPIDEARDAFVDARLRLEAEVALDRADVRIGVAHVAGLHLAQPPLRLAAAGLLDQADHPGQLFGPVVADIVEAVRAAAAAGFLLAVVGRRIVEA